VVGPTSSEGLLVLSELDRHLSSLLDHLIVMRWRTATETRYRFFLPHDVYALYMHTAVNVVETSLSACHTDVLHGNETAHYPAVIM